MLVSAKFQDFFYFPTAPLKRVRPCMGRRVKDLINQSFLWRLFRSAWSSAGSLVTATRLNAEQP